MNVCLFLMLLTFGGSLTVVTAGGPSSRAHDLAYLIRGNVGLFLEASNTFPTTWTQIFADGQYWAERNRATVTAMGKVIPELFVLTPTNLSLLPPQAGFVIAAARQPMNESGTWGRFTVIKDDNQNPFSAIRTVWIAERDFQKMLAQSGVKLPDPDPVELAAAKAAVEALLAREQREHEMIRHAAPKPSAAEVWALSWERIQSWFVIPQASGASGGQLRIVPTGFGVLFFLGLGALGWHWWRKKRGSN